MFDKLKQQNKEFEKKIEEILNKIKPFEDFGDDGCLIAINELEELKNLLGENHTQEIERRNK